MASSLRQHLNDLATTFANSVLAAIRTASIEDLLAESGGGRRASAPAAAAPRGRAKTTGKGGRLARRSAADIGGMIESIVSLLKSTPEGMRAEEIRAKLGWLPKEMPRPLKEGVAAGALTKKGEKRATTYFAKGGGGSAPRAARPAKKGAKKK